MAGTSTDRPRRRRALAALAAALAAAVAAVALLTSGDHSGTRPSQPAPAPGPRLFSPTSFWNEPLPAGVPVDPSSTRLAASLAAEIARERAADIGPWIQTDESSTPLYTVPRGQAKVRVRLDGPVRPSNASLRRALSAVPIPAGARPAAGSERQLTVWQPATDRLWELWRARRAADGWHAAWGGAIAHVSRSAGYYDRSAWPGARPNWGATATSLPKIGGTILLREIRAGRIDHALAFNVPDARAGVFAWPAQRTDGAGPAADLPEGARLRLDPRLDVAGLHLRPLARMIALAAQRYGIVVRDRTHHASAFYAEDVSPMGIDPYRGDGGAFGGMPPDQVLAGFPWNRLQVLRMHLCASAPCPRGGSP